jgi:hypothetical protein
LIQDNDKSDGPDDNGQDRFCEQIGPINRGTGSRRRKDPVRNIKQFVANDHGQKQKKTNR